MSPKCSSALRRGRGGRVGHLKPGIANVSQMEQQLPVIHVPLHQVGGVTGGPVLHGLIGPIDVCLPHIGDGQQLH